MNIYLAGRYSRRAELAGYRDELRALGHTVTSRWLDGTHEAIDGDWRQHPDLARQWALDDVEDVLAADILVLFSEDPDTPQRRGGRHVEYGVAFGWEKTTAVVGPHENIFHHLADRHFPGGWPQAYGWFLQEAT